MATATLKPDKKRKKETGFKATKKKTGPRIPAPEFPSPTLENPPMSEIITEGTRDIELRQIAESPLNPRRFHDDAAEIKTLSKSLRDHGQLQELVVTPNDMCNGYELIAGARRLRAAKLARLKTLRCRVVDVTEEEAIELRGIENFRRRNFDAIEEARWFAQMTGQCNYTQTALAKRLGVSQGHVANRIRLLGLPYEWQKKVSAGELPATHTRFLLPWVEYEAVLNQVAKHLDPDEPLAVVDFQLLVDGAVRRNSKEMSGLSPSIRKKLTKEQLTALKIVEVCPPWGGARIKHAMNVELFDKLSYVATKQRQVREDAKSKRDAKSPQKNTAAEKRRKEKTAARIFAKRLYLWKIRWLQTQIAEKLNFADAGQVLRLLLFFATGYKPLKRIEGLESAITAAAGRIKSNRPARSIDVWATLNSVVDKKMGDVALKALGAWVRHDVENFNADIAPGDVEQIADALGVNLKQDWRLTEDYLELHTTGQLIALAQVWKMNVNPGAAKQAIITELMLQAKEARCPKELTLVKPVPLR